MENIIEEMALIMCGREGCKTCIHFIEATKCAAIVSAKKLYNADYHRQKEGEWIEHGEIGAMNNAWECSACHWKTVSFTEMKHSNFCPNCGAKMKGGAE